MITIFTPSFADASNTNAQNLTVKEVVARLSPEKFKVRMWYSSTPDQRIAERPNTELLAYGGYGNTARLLGHLLLTRPDLYYFPREGPLDAAFLFVRKYLRLRTALVTYIVSSQDQGAPSHLLARAIREGDGVAGNSEYVAKTIVQRFGTSVETIHDGISRQFFSPPAESQRANSPLIVLYAGAFQRYKRVPLVIEEASRRPNVRFRLAGRGVEESACREMSESMGCRNVEFLGHLSQPRLGEEMRCADIFFFPSAREGHPQVLGQAAACGLPCIAMNVYRPDYVVHGETGFLAETDAELSEKLGLLLTQSELLRSMSAAAVRHSLKFDWDRIVKDWELLFEQAVTRRRSFLAGSRP